MPSRPLIAALFAGVCLATLMGPSPAAAASSTTEGRISVAQVLEMLDKAPADRTARQVLIAYLAGVGETAGVLVSAGERMDWASCRERLSLNDAQAREALEAVGALGNATQTAATPLILRDMLDRAGCRLDG